MKLLRAEALAGKRFEALMAAAERIENSLDEKTHLEYEKLYANGEEFEIRATLDAGNRTYGFAELAEVVRDDATTIEKVLTSRSTPAVQVSINPNKLR